MNEKLKEIVSNMSYENYILMQGGSFWTALLLNIAGGYFNSLPLKGVSCGGTALYLFLVFSRLENHTKELVAIRSAYNDILDNYAKFMREFSLNNPIQISTMHANMVDDGYLSVENKFKFNGGNVYDSHGLEAKNIINGHGVCRHIASLLSDLLNKMEIDAFNLPVYYSDCGLKIQILDNEIGQARETIYNNVRKYFVDPESVEQIMEVIDEIIEEHGKGVNANFYSSTSENIIKSFIEKIIGNHLICFAVQNGYGYYLDPTMKRIYHMDLEEFGLLSDGDLGELRVKLLSSRVHNTRDTFDKMYGKVSDNYPSEDRDTINRIVKETTKLYKDNQDICEQFYQDNKDNYQNIVHNLSYMKVNRYSKK